MSIVGKTVHIFNAHLHAQNVALPITAPGEGINGVFGEVTDLVAGRRGNVLAVVDLLWWERLTTEKGMRTVTEMEMKDRCDPQFVSLDVSRATPAYDFVPPDELLIDEVRFSSGAIVVWLRGGQQVGAPLSLYPRLAEATEAQRNNWHIIGNGEGVRWSELDEDISARGFLERGRVSGSRVPPDEPPPKSKPKFGEPGYEPEPGEPC